MEMLPGMQTESREAAARSVAPLLHLLHLRLEEYLADSVLHPVPDQVIISLLHEGVGVAVVVCLWVNCFCWLL